MKNNLKIFFLLCHLTIVTPLFSQDINIKINLENKYWVWRDRLVNDFMVPATHITDFGRGIIFNKRGNEYYYDNTFKGGFDIGDEGFQMGKYLIVLASEWKLLKMSGISTNEVEKEIYYELQTINRLDYFADYFWNYFWLNSNSYSTGDYNGFMIRDDVFRNFIWKDENFPDFQQDYPNISYDDLLKFGPSSTTSPGSYPIINYMYLNQGDDGVTGKYIKQNILPSNGSNTVTKSLMYLHKKIRNYDRWDNAGKANDNVPKNKGISGAEAGIWASYHDYSDNELNWYNVTGPEEYSQDNYIGLLQGLVAISQLVGSSAYYDSHNLNQMAKELIHRIIISIRNNENGDNWVIDNPVTNKCVKGIHWTEYLSKNNSNSNHYCIGGGADAGMYSGNFAEVHNLFTDYSDISGQLINSIGPVTSANADQASPLATLSGLKSNSKICSWVDNKMSSNDQKQFSYLDLLYCVLHGGSSVRGYQYYYNILNNESCGVDYSNIMGSNNPNNYGNNLSVMIIHNLLKILQNEPYYSIKLNDDDTYPIVTPEITVTIIPPPYGGGYTVSVHYHAACTKIIENPYNIESTAIIGNYPGGTDQGNVSFDPPCNANVTYIAKKKIELKPGFRVKHGAKFRAQIDYINGCEVLPPTNMSVFAFPPGIDYSNGQSMLLLSSINNEKQQSLAEMESKTIEKNDLNNYKNNKFSISPNPTTGIVNITVENSDENHLLYIKNSIGKEIYSTDFKGNLNLNLSSYPKGIYLIIITDSGYANPSINKIILI